MLKISSKDNKFGLLLFPTFHALILKKKLYFLTSCKKNPNTLFFADIFVTAALSMLH